MSVVRRLGSPPLVGLDLISQGLVDGFLRVSFEGARRDYASATRALYTSSIQLRQFRTTGPVPSWKGT